MILLMAFSRTDVTLGTVTQWTSAGIAVSVSEVMLLLDYTSHYEVTGGREGTPPLTLNLGTTWS